MAPTCNPSTLRLRQEDPWESKASLDSAAGAHLSQRQKGWLCWSTSVTPALEVRGHQEFTVILNHKAS